MNNEEVKNNEEIKSKEQLNDERKHNPFLKRPLKSTKIKNIIAVLSGKGGVGKSMTTSMLAVSLAKKGYKVGIMDADITGPSIPKMFGTKSKLFGSDEGILPINSKTLGIKLMSVNYMLDSEEAPVMWRGPILGGVIHQFYQEVVWGELDYLLIDMPPGTGDVALTVFQSLPVDGIVIVTSPQSLVSMIVSKAVNMAEKLNVPVIGLVENMAYVECPKCGERIEIFNKSTINEVANNFNLEILAQMPIDPKFASLADEGDLESFESDLLDKVVETCINL